MISRVWRRSNYRELHPSTDIPTSQQHHIAGPQSSAASLNISIYPARQLKSDHSSSISVIPISMRAILRQSEDRETKTSIEVPVIGEK